MVHRPLKKLTPHSDSDRVLSRWLGELEERLTDPACDRSRLCRDTLYDTWYPGAGRYEDVLNDPETSLATRSALVSLDPQVITLEPEYYHEIDHEQYARVKPLLWLWQSFDRSPLGGGNVDLGVRLRRLLAQHVFRRCGRNFKCFQFVEFSFGYNMEVGDDVVVHRHVLLDDRGGIVLGSRVSIADYANIYSHTHSLSDQVDVTNAVTTLGDDVRITYNATVLAGVQVGHQAIVGAGAVLTRDAKPWHLYLGVPAKPMRVKPNAPPDIGGAFGEPGEA
jgi:acetyltransferase-like isoleucine patch superfamily enzyme